MTRQEFAGPLAIALMALLTILTAVVTSLDPLYIIMAVAIAAAAILLYVIFYDRARKLYTPIIPKNTSSHGNSTSKESTADMTEDNQENNEKTSLPNQEEDSKMEDKG